MDQNLRLVAHQWRLIGDEVPICDASHLETTEADHESASQQALL